MSTNRDAGEALQKGIFDQLTDALGATKVLDHVTEGAAKPYVVIGDIDIGEWGAKAGEDGTEAQVAIECFADASRGRKAVRQLQRKVYDALHHQESAITVEGNRLVMIRFDSSSADRMADGLSYQGISRFRALIESTE